MREKMKKDIFCVALSALLLALGWSAEAQQPMKIPSIGFLSGRASPTPTAPDSLLNSFRDGLRELGYIEGKNIAIEYRFAGGKNERLPSLAAELVRLKVDVIVSSALPSSQAAKQATSTIPIVLNGVGDPVAWGLVESLARPGGNVTGLVNFSPELSGKRVELLKEAFPSISRVAVLRDPRQPPQSFTETQNAGQLFGLKLQSLEIRDEADVDRAFSVMSKDRVEALITLPQSAINVYRKRILEFSAKKRLPSIYADKLWVEAGGLMSYGPDQIDISRRAAIYVDKILKGAKPADLAVEQPTQFELWLNLKTAKQLGVTIPQSVLYRADKVIK